MKISEFLSPTETLINVRASEKEKLLQALAQRASTKLNLAEGEIIAELLKREGLGSTGMGNGVAIPHARFQAIKKPFGIVARLKQPIEFEAIDGQPVDIVFVLLLPSASEGEQLGALACVARKLRSSSDLAKLRKAKSAADLYGALTADLG
jgi:PTS system nitrogen regulatory IIA component